MKTITLRHFVKELQHALGQAVVQNSIQLGKGQCVNHEEYKAKVGYIRGLEAASEISAQMHRALEDAAREEDSKLPEMPPLTPPEGIKLAKGEAK